MQVKRLFPLILAIAACSARQEREAPRVTLPEIALQHAEVDRLLDAGDPRTARALLERMRASAAGLPHVVLQDIDFRLAGASLALGDAKAALAASERGLALARGEDVFTANLEVASGRAREALGQREEASAAYGRALAIDEHLLEEALKP